MKIPTLMNQPMRKQWRNNLAKCLDFNTKGQFLFSFQYAWVSFDYCNLTGTFSNFRIDGPPPPYIQEEEDNPLLRESNNNNGDINGNSMADANNPNNPDNRNNRNLNQGKVVVVGVKTMEKSWCITLGKVRIGTEYFRCIRALHSE